MIIAKTTLAAALFAVAVGTLASQPAAARDTKDPRDLVVATNRTVAAPRSVDNGTVVTRVNPSSYTMRATH